MKNIFVFAVFAFLISGCAQRAPQGRGAADTETGVVTGGASSTNSPPSAVALSQPADKPNTWISEMGPYHRVFTTISSNSASTNPQTLLIPGSPSSPVSTAARTKTQRIVERGSGINFWDGQQYLPSVAAFEVSPAGDAFLANRIQHKTRVSAELNSQSALAVTMPDGTIFRATPVAIGLADPIAGTATNLAFITNCSGVLSSSNQVLFEDAFNQNGVRVSVLFSIQVGSLAQDVVLTRLDPAQHGYSPQNCLVQIVTELYDVAEPDRIRHPVGANLIDEILGWNELVLGAGRAYATGSGTNFGSAPVAKEMRTDPATGRKFLIESVPFTSIQNGLQAANEAKSKANYASVRSQPARPAFRTPQPALASLPTPPVNRIKRDPSVMAKVTPRRLSGATIDYLATIGGTLNNPVIFPADETVFVSASAPIICNGPVTIEGGCVFKYPTAASNTFIQINNTLTLKTSSYRPAIFTAADDSSVGDGVTTTVWSGYTGTIRSGGYASPALSFSGYQSVLSLSNLRFCYARQALLIGDYPGQEVDLSHSQLVNCISGIALSGSGILIRANNCLFANVGAPLDEQNSGAYYGYWNLLHCTIDTSSQVLATVSSDSTLACTNCIFSNVGSAGLDNPSADYNGFYNTTPFGNDQTVSSASPFQIVGGGSYYLSANSPYRNAGTTNINAGLWSDLRAKTTYPPIVWAGAVFSSSDIVLSPQVQRDVDTPDLGYHYDPLDFAFGWVVVTNAITVTINPGTAIACFGTNGFGYGLAIDNGAQFLCQGTATAPIHIVEFSAVQEQAGVGWLMPWYAMVTDDVGQTGYAPATPAAAVNCRFTDFSSMAMDTAHLGFYSSPSNLRDCQMDGGIFVTFAPSTMTNCLFERVYTDVEAPSNTKSIMRNCLFYGGQFYLAPAASVTNVIVKDNLFIQTVMLCDLTYQGYDGGYNAYLTNCDRLKPIFASDPILTNIDFQSGPLGNYYYPTNGGNLSRLINSGSVTNAGLVGLYHYTVMTNLLNGLEIKETNSVVDIGFHYVAVGSNGLPISTSGDGLGDYLKDSNGDGVYGAGDLGNWLSADTAGDGTSDYIKFLQGRNLNVRVISDTNGVIHLQVFTPLK